MENESFIFDWLTYSWLNENIGMVIVILLVSVGILFIFPLLLGYDLKKEENQKKNKKETDG